MSIETNDTTITVKFPVCMAGVVCDTGSGSVTIDGTIEYIAYQLEEVTPTPGIDRLSRRTRRYIIMCKECYDGIIDKSNITVMDFKERPHDIEIPMQPQSEGLPEQP
ncbi:MAG: hypothetical protein GF411_02770 [Candidatus Lokiarchaeota archaeon]|nr:hypothetical protein [Candidatus Lokiarchaeota archaeon]